MQCANDEERFNSLLEEWFPESDDDPAAIVILRKSLRRYLKAALPPQSDGNFLRKFEKEHSPQAFRDELELYLLLIQRKLGLGSTFLEQVSLPRC